MVRVELRDIVTDADRDAVLGVRRGPGQHAFVASVEDSFQDAIDDAHAVPRMWSVHDAATGAVVGFVMISDGIPAERLAADDDIIGPYYLWRLLIDEEVQRRGYGTATIDAVVAYLATRPGAEVLYTSCSQGDGTPQPFYERYGFRPTGEVKWGEVVLRLDLTRSDMSEEAG
jgi:diamine N-acetyltransferase